MTQQVTFDRGSSAVLIMDFQNDIVRTAASDPDGVVQRAASVLRGARQAGIPVIYVCTAGDGSRRLPRGLRSTLG